MSDIILPNKNFQFNSSVIVPYDYNDDMPWSEKNPHFQVLADRFVYAGNSAYIKDKVTGTWHEAPAKGESAAINTRLVGIYDAADGLPVAINVEAIEAYKKYGALTFEDTTYAPGAADYVIFRRSKRLNVYLDERAPGRRSDVPAVQEFLTVIYHAICGQEGPTPDLDRLISMIETERNEYSWLMQLLAAKFQNPGLVTYTNPWLVGPVRGIGKSTLITLLRELFGHRAVNKVEMREVEGRGWLDTVFGSLINEWDEVITGKNNPELPNTVKNKTGNPTVMVTTRNKSPKEHPATAIHIFTTNSKHPMPVEPHDRQNTFIACTENTEWKIRAAGLYDPAQRVLVNKDQLVSGFSALLSCIRYDINFITQPLMTPLKQALIEDYAPSWQSWYEDLPEESNLFEFPDMGSRSARDIYRAYVQDCTSNNVDRVDIVKERDFFREMRRNKWLLEKRTARTNLARLRRHNESAHDAYRESGII